VALTAHNGSRRDVLLLVDSPRYVSALNSVLTGAATVVSQMDIHRPLGLLDDREYEVPEFCRESLSGLIDCAQLEAPYWWVVRKGHFVRTLVIDLISTATVCGRDGLLLVEAKAHYGELETCGKSFRGSSSPENHDKIGESIELANRALNAIEPGFRLQRDAFYQLSNRVSWAWRLASLGLPVTLLYLGFPDDPYWPADDRFSSAAAWADAAGRYLANVVPVGVVGRRLRCSAAGSLSIATGALPAIPVT
jgi:hypothetical protein